MKSTIEWFRKRKSSQTNEKYLHSGEELRQKQMIQNIVKQLHKVKQLQHKIKLNPQEIQNLEEGNRFMRKQSDSLMNQTLQNFNTLTDRSRLFTKTNYGGNVFKQAQSMSQNSSPKRNNFQKCIIATLKTVEIDDKAIEASRTIESKVKKIQRKQIQKQIHYPTNDQDAKKCIRQFVQLFQKDGQQVLEESNEFYQMKKIQLKSTLAQFNSNSPSIDTTISNIPQDMTFEKAKIINQKPINRLCNLNIITLFSG